MWVMRNGNAIGFALMILASLIGLLVWWDTSGEETEEEAENRWHFDAALEDARVREEDKRLREDAVYRLSKARKEIFAREHEIARKAKLRAKKEKEAADHEAADHFFEKYEEFINGL